MPCPSFAPPCPHGPHGVAEVRFDRSVSDSGWKAEHQKDAMRTLFLNPPSYDDFDGWRGRPLPGQARGLVVLVSHLARLSGRHAPGARLLDAPPLGLTLEQTLAVAKGLRARRHPHQHAVVSRRRAHGPRLEGRASRDRDRLVGGHVTARPEESLRYAGAVDYAARKEFDHAVVAVAEGRPFDQVRGISYLRGATYVENQDAVPLGTTELMPCRSRPTSTPGTSTTRSTTVPIVSTRTCRCTPAAAVRRTARSVSGRR